MDRGAWRATVHRVAQSWTRLKRPSIHAQCITNQEMYFSLFHFTSINEHWAWMLYKILSKLFAWIFSFLSLTNFLEYCFPHFPKENEWQVQGHIVSNWQGRNWDHQWLQSSKLLNSSSLSWGMWVSSEWVWKPTERHPMIKWYQCVGSGKTWQFYLWVFKTTSAELGEGQRAIHITKMMELVGKKDRLKKTRFCQSKKRQDTITLDRIELRT